MDLVEAQARESPPAVRHPWEQARLEVVKKLIVRHAKLGDRAVIMDVGCGDTFVAEQLARQHPDAVLYAIDAAFTDQLMARCRMRFETSNILPFPSLDAISPPPGRPASLVLLMDFIEHIADDVGFLRNVVSRPYIHAETRFIVTVPAYQSLFCSHDAFLGHFRRYSNRLLRARLEASGLSVVDVGYFFFSLLPVRLLQVLKERAFRVEPARPTTGLIAWNGGAARAILMREVLLYDALVSLGLTKIRIRLPGLSGYAVCRKSA
jgi:hypothetical protein